MERLRADTDRVQRGLPATALVLAAAAAVAGGAFLWEDPFFWPWWASGSLTLTLLAAVPLMVRDAEDFRIACAVCGGVIVLIAVILAFVLAFVFLPAGLLLVGAAAFRPGE